jgi:hypothetical protein
VITGMTRSDLAAQKRRLNKLFFFIIRKTLLGFLPFPRDGFDEDRAEA